VVQKKDPVALKRRSKGDEPARDYNTHYAGSQTRNQIKLLDRTRSDLVNLAIGRDDSVARLIASTLWFSPSAARAVWGVVGGPVGVDRCVKFEGETYVLRI
jgi:hypothetical protein